MRFAPQHSTAFFSASLECYPDASSHGVILVVGTGDFTVVVDIGGNALVPYHRNAGADRQTVATSLRAGHCKAIAGATPDDRNDLEVSVPVFVHPGGAEFWYHGHVTYFPVIRHSSAESRAFGFEILIGKL